MSTSEHNSRYAKKRAGKPGPNAMHVIAEEGADGVWRVNGVPYVAPRKVRYAGKDGAGRDIFTDQVTGERVW
jgi:hypothetical protein